MGGLLAAGWTGVAAAAPDGRGVLLDAPGPPAGVSSLPVDPAAVPRTPAKSATLSLRPKDPAAAARLRRAPGARPAGEGGGYFCTEFINHAFGPVGEDDFLEETVDMAYYAQVDCNFYLASMEGIAGVIDRSDGFNGESFDGRVLGTGTPFYKEWDYTANSAGALGVRARDYNGGRKVEFAFELFLLAPEGIIWDACNPVPGLRYLVCEGLGTPLLHVVMGTGPLSGGLTRPCRDLRAPVDPEQARLFQPPGSPASTQILRTIPSIKNRVTRFKRDLCDITNAGAAETFARQQGADLWGTAVEEAQRGAEAGDDRPLYWARLSMTTALRQWVASFDRSGLQVTVDRASRGMNSHDFSPGSPRKAFISGYDPFDLDSDIRTGNPSGAAVLRLDGKTVNGAEVQAVIFPVRYDDFDAALVEDVFRRHLTPGAQQATVVTTVSQGGDRFDLEFYNGRRRASNGGSPLTDNRNRLPVPGCGGCGTYANPADINAPGGAEFTQTTLPVDRMLGGAYEVRVQTNVDEKFPPGSTSAPRADGPSIGSTAVQGSGGGFLSNEIAYRVTRLRDELRVNVPAGHVHTPDNHGDRVRISAQYEQILGRAIANAGVLPIQLRTDRDTYRVGDTPVYSVSGPANAQIKWSSTFNGLLREIDVDNGRNTDGNGDFVGSYHTWQSSEAGQWVKYIRVNGRLAKVALTVEPAGSRRRAVRADFDGDRRSDVSLWRPANGTWYVTPSGGQPWFAFPFGLSGDLPVDGDFDGDGRTDHAVFRPSDGTWYLQQSRDGFRAVSFGQADDVPVPADFNADGRTDVAVWRASEGNWYFWPSGEANYFVVPFGIATDKPVQEDYDGDGAADIAVYRRDNGTWIIRQSSNGQVTFATFGESADRPVPADYDGDGKADLAVFRPTQGAWWVRRSSDAGVRVEAWGLASDVATPADFDGDARTDVAVFRPSDGAWWIRRSGGGDQVSSFGQNGDIPIPGVNHTR